MAKFFRPMVPRHGIGSSIAITGAQGCVTATVLTETFPNSSPGTISSGAPGPLNSWTYQGQAGSGVLVSFSLPQQMICQCNTAHRRCGARRLLQSSLPAIEGTTHQFTFQEFGFPLDGSFYEFMVTDDTNLTSLYLYLDGTGLVFVQAGVSASTTLYSGLWVPTPGISHIVHLVIPAVGAPVLSIDSGPISLTPGASTPSGAVAFAGGQCLVQADAFTPGGGSSNKMNFSSIFVAMGEYPDGTIFCT